MQQKTKIILAIAGIALSLMFIFAAGALYQNLYIGNPEYTDNLFEFRDILRSEGWTINLSLLTVLMPWGMALLYYYLIDSVHFDRWWHWLIVEVVVVIATPLASYKMLSDSMEKLEPGMSYMYNDLTVLLSVWNALFAAMLFVISSYSIRWWSNNCRHTPLPQ